MDDGFAYGGKRFCNEVDGVCRGVYYRSPDDADIREYVVRAGKVAIEKRLISKLTVAYASR